MRRATALPLLLVCGLVAAGGVAQGATVWTEPLDISPRDGYTIYMSDLAVDRHGDVAAVGETYSAPDGLVVYSSLDRGPFDGEEVNDSGAEGPAIAFDRAGGLVVLSHKVDFGNAIRAYTRPLGGSFGAAQLLDHRPGYPYGVATAPNGAVIAYWLGTDQAGSETYELRAAVRRAGAAEFGPVQDVSEPGLPAEGVQLVFDRAGNTLIAWTVDGRLEYAIRPPGGSFGTRRVLAAAAGYGATHAIAATPAGRAVAAWRASGGAKHQVRAAFGTVADGFGASRRIGGDANRGPFVALDRDGEAVAAWQVRSGSSSVLRAAVAAPAAERFGASRRVHSGYSEPVGVVADGHGTATVAWLDGATLWAARHTADTPGFAKEPVDRSNVRDATLGVTADGRTVLAAKATRKGRRVRAAVARSGHPFGAPKTLTRFARSEGIQGPYVGAGGDGGAFVWWGTDLETAKRETIWFSGSYLLP